MLAAYAVRVENSRGRRHPEPQHPYRNDFQRDRDRVIHSRSFRRLDAAMRRHGFFFDHNLHALRIVEDFELRYAAFRGLNLTFEVREGIIKHSHDYTADNYPELSEYLLEQCPPLEAQLIDLADEIAYSTADLDDGYEARLLTLEQIREGVPVFELFFREVEQIYPNAIDKLKFN